jgi:hypothetical protein
MHYTPGMEDLMEMLGRGVVHAEWRRRSELKDVLPGMLEVAVNAPVERIWAH